MKREEIFSLVRNSVAKVLHRNAEDFGENENLMRLGITSIEVTSIITAIKKRIKVSMNPVALFEYKTIGEFVEYLVQLDNK